MSTLGGPLTDVGLPMFSWDVAPRLGVGLAQSVTALPGFSTAVQMAESCSLKTGIGLGELAWYRAFAHLTFAAIVLGVQARVAAGAMAGQSFGDLAATVATVAEGGLAIVTE